MTYVVDLALRLINSFADEPLKLQIAVVFVTVIVLGVGTFCLIAAHYRPTLSKQDEKWEIIRRRTNAPRGNHGRTHRPS